MCDSAVMPHHDTTSFTVLGRPLPAAMHAGCGTKNYTEYTYLHCMYTYVKNG